MLTIMATAADGLKVGHYEQLQARAAAIAAANPRHAARILGRRPPVAPKLKPVAATPKEAAIAVQRKDGRPSNGQGRPGKYPWRALAIGDWFDVAAGGTITRKAIAKQAGMARKRCDARFGVMLIADKAGRSVIRVTRVG